MSRSVHRDDFFQTTSSIDDSRRKAEKSKNKNGNPIKLQSKILAIAADPLNSGSVYVAESAGTLRRIILETGEKAAVYTGPTAPLTSLCFAADGKTVFAGCWDKTIWSWDVASRKPKLRYQGHTDFVKTVVCSTVGDVEVLISGGADAELIVWRVSDGQRLHSIKEHGRAIQDLAIDPIIPEDHPTSLNVFSAGSDPTIRQVHLSSASEARTTADPILQHETSVYKLFFDADGDLWTASADKTAKCLTRQSNWTAEVTLEHPDFVRDIVVFESAGYVVTACRDEEVRIWNRATGDLFHTYSGHFEEVTGLLLVNNATVVSISIDATIRQWSLDPAKIQIAKAEAEGTAEEKAEDTAHTNLLTEEEERELAELMDDD